MTASGEKLSERRRAARYVDTLIVRNQELFVEWYRATYGDSLITRMEEAKAKAGRRPLQGGDNG